MRTISLLSRIPLVALCGAIVLLSSISSASANPDPDNPTTLEILKLPKYCQGQLIKQFQGAPGYAFPSNCGVWMNHFCYGLNFLNRANNATLPKGKRQWNAKRARTDINYTKDHMTGGCSISKDVAAADMRLRTLEMFIK